MTRFIDYLILAAAYALITLGFVSAACGQTTQPAHATTAVAVPPIPLAPLLAGKPAGSTVTLAKGNYSVPTTIRLLVNMHGNGSTISVAPTSGEVFIIAQSRLTIDGFVIPKADVAFRFLADSATVSNCTIGVGVPNGSVHQATITGPGGTNPTILLTHVGVTGTVSSYFDRDGPRIINCLYDGSIGEYAVRGDTPDGTTIPTGFLIQNSEIGTLQNSVNLFGKDTLGWRMFKNCHVTGSTIHRDIRLGQGAATTPGQYCTATIDHCTFVDAHAGLPYLEEYAGATLSATFNTFVMPLDPCISCGSNSTCYTAGNIVQLAHGGPAYPLYASSSMGTHTEGLPPDKVIVLPPTK